MTKPLLLTMLAISVFLLNTAKAQTDSAHYDLGRIRVNKDFTQNITIKASDLERYQFNNITDALDVFFYGTFTNSSSVVYVIDGNIVNDVNAYSIQDVEEITLVQNALGQVSGASPSQQLILIKTRRGGPGKQGVTASSQTSLVNARNNNNYSNATKPTGIYEQAYVGAYKNYTNADIGVSANYLRNVSPQDLPSVYTAFDPFHYNRFRLNIYADTKLWQGTTLSFGANYTPETNNESYTGGNNTASTQVDFVGKYHESQHLFNTDIRLRSHIVSGLTNTLSAGYNHYNDFENGATVQTVSDQGSVENTTHSLQTWGQRSRSFLLKDNLAYHLQSGDWSIDPSVNFMYRHLNDSLSLAQEFYQDSQSGSNYTLGSSQYAHYSLSLLTPSLNINYKDIFNIQGGFTGILNKEDFGNVITIDHVLPFASASLNVSELAGVVAIKLRLFASFSRQNEFMNDPYVSLDAFTMQGFDNAGGTYSPVPNQLVTVGYNVLQAYNNYQGGFMLGLTKNFSLSYNYQEDYDATIVQFTVPDGGNGSELIDAIEKVKIITNRIGLNYHIYSGKVDWATGLNATESKLQLSYPSGYPAAEQALSSGHRWTGGFTNRFTYGHLFAGVDILYQAGNRLYSLQNWQSVYPANPTTNVNSFSLQNLYIGTKVKIEHLKYAEIYLSTRNIWQNKTSDITDERRFYGFGFKLGL